MNHTITDIPGIRVGHAQDDNALTGCTVILCEDGAVAGVDQRGGAPGTRETDLLRPMHLVQQVHAVLLAGGSAFGLDAASGVVRYLEEHGAGFDAGVARVPIVPAAVLFDLGYGRADIRPDAAMGYQACLNASAKPVEQGNIGAGMGATVGKILGPMQAMKAGIGSASVQLGGGIFVGAIVAVNTLGDILDPATGKIIAGARGFEMAGAQSGPAEYFADTLRVMNALSGAPGEGSGSQFAGSNTTIGVIATNGALNKEQINKVAQMAQDGLARAIRPAHTLYDGDTIFALSTGARPADVNTIGAYAAEVFAQAVVNAALKAQPLGGLPSAMQMPPMTKNA